MKIVNIRPDQLPTRIGALSPPDQPPLTLGALEAALVGARSCSYDPETRTAVLRYGPADREQRFRADATGAFVRVDEPAHETR